MKPKATPMATVKATTVGILGNSRSSGLAERNRVRDLSGRTMDGLAGFPLGGCNGAYLGRSVFPTVVVGHIGRLGRESGVVAAASS